MQMKLHGSGPGEKTSPPMYLQALLLQVGVALWDGTFLHGLPFMILEPHQGKESSFWNSLLRRCNQSWYPDQGKCPHFSSSLKEGFPLLVNVDKI